MEDPVLDLIDESPFATFDEALRFAEWYDSRDHHTNWDDERYTWAAQIIEAVEKEPPHAAR